MSNFREQAEKIVKDWLVNDEVEIQLNTQQLHSLLYGVLRDIEALHKKEVERIIGEDDKTDTEYPDINEAAWDYNTLRAEQRRRAGLEGKYGI